MVLLVSLLAVATQARARQSTESEARRHFQKGNASSAEGRYGDALASYREAYRLQPRPNVLFNIARCEELLGDSEAAYRDYRAFFEHADGANPLRADARAKMEALAQTITVAVSITSIPAGAAVFVDGASDGTARTPAILRLRPGAHRVRLQA